MKRFNITKTCSTIVYGMRIPKGAIYGKINGVFYYITDTKLHNNGTMSYIIVSENGGITFKNNVSDTITEFVLQTLEKHQIRGTGVLYNELQEAELQAEKARKEELARKQMERAEKLEKELREYRRQKYFVGMMEDYVCKRKHKFTVHENVKTGKKLDSVERVISTFGDKALSNLIGNETAREAILMR